MDLVEDGHGHIAYRAWPTEKGQDPWCYDNTWWLVESAVAVTIMSYFRNTYAVLYESAWTTHKQRELDTLGREDVDWQLDPAELDGRNAIAAVETGRIFFPGFSREAVEEAARFTSNGVYIVPQSVEQGRIVALAQETGFDRLSERIAVLSTALVYADRLSNVTIDACDLHYVDEVTRCGHLAIALLDDPAVPLREGFKA